MSDTSCEYPNNRVQGVASAKQILEFETAPGKVSSTIQGLNKTQLDYKIAPHEWNITQVLVHLADTEMFFSERIRKILAEDNPSLQSFNQDAWANALFYDKQDYRLALDLLRAQRKSTAAVLRFLPEEAWQRKGIHEGKERTIFDVFLTATQHISTHLQQIQNIKHDPHFPSS